MPKKKFPSNEYKTLEQLKPFLNYSPSKRYPFGIGDDAAVRKWAGDKNLILTGDIFVEDVHFSFKYMSLAEAGYKAMVSNLSDCASMGAVPDSALIQICFPCSIKNVNPALKKLYSGFFNACKKWDFPIIGGDISKGPCWIIAITLTGRNYKDFKPLKRTGIRHNDSLWVTGFPGQSAAGLEVLKKWNRKNIPLQFKSLARRHIKPVPRIEAGKRFAETGKIRGVMDLSDGISKDGATLCHENNLGLILEFNDNSVPKSMIELGESAGAGWLPWALNGGEDYELIFSAPKGLNPCLLRLPPDVKPVKIGTFTREKRGIFIKKDNSIRPVPPLGWDHL